MVRHLAAVSWQCNQLVAFIRPGRMAPATQAELLRPKRGKRAVQPLPAKRLLLRLLCVAQPNMFRSLFPFRRLLATSFLLVFVNVFAGQCYCATMNQPMAATRLASHYADEAPAEPSHPGCHGIAKAGHYGDKHHSKKSTRSHDCCKDKSASLLSSLTTPSQKQLLSPAPALLPEAVAFHFRPLAGQWNRTLPVQLVPLRHLPPKIPDIRIFIQSLTV